MAPVMACRLCWLPRIEKDCGPENDGVAEKDKVNSDMRVVVAAVDASAAAEFCEDRMISPRLMATLPISGCLL